MGDIGVFDGELRIVSRAGRVARVPCDRAPCTELIDQVLDERAAAECQG